MLVYDYQKRVRYGETDQMGYLYYGHYAKYYEIGRAETIRSVGTSYKELEIEHKIMMPVISLESRFRKPAYYDDLLTIRTILKELPTKMFSFSHEIYNDKNELLNTGLVKLFCVDMKTQKRVSVPDYIVQKLAPYFE